MTSTTLKNAQECLIIEYDDCRKKIIDLENLLHRHSTDMVLNFLSGLSQEYEKLLKNLIVSDRTSPKIDEIVSRLFRIFMAMRTIKREDGEVIAA